MCVCVCRVCVCVCVCARMINIYHSTLNTRTRHFIYNMCKLVTYTYTYIYIIYNGVAPRACVRVYAHVLVPPNLYIHTYIHT